MDFVFHNHSVNQQSALKSVLWQYNQVRYGLKFYLWTNRDKKAIVAHFKESGLWDKYRIAPTRRQEDGSYNSDGSDFDWDTYNKDAWKYFSDDFDGKTCPETLGLKSVKAVQEQKTKLLLYFLENYAHKVDLEFKSKPMMPKTPIVDNDGVSILLLSRQPEFSIKSPNGAIELILSKSKSGQFVTTIKDNCDRELIQIPQLGLPLFERMFHYASIITDKPTDVMNNPHYHLGLEVNIERQFQSAQEFLLEQNKLAVARRNEQKAKYEPKSLTHDNFSDKPKPTASDKVVITPTEDNTTITKEVKVNFHTTESNLPLYEWDDIHTVDGVHYYGITRYKLIEWLLDLDCDVDEFYNWCCDERIFVIIDGYFDTLSSDSTTNTFWTLEGTCIDSNDVEVLYIEEPDFQIYKNLYLDT